MPTPPPASATDTPDDAKPADEDVVDAEFSEVDDEAKA